MKWFILTVTLLVGVVLVSKRQLTEKEVRALAYKITAEHFPAVDPEMLVRMAKIESNFMPWAFRYEPHINDASFGLMQTLTKTAEWLYEDMGAKAYSPSFISLLSPEASMYFAAAMVNWLKNYKGVGRSEEWIVRAYNGGPNWQNAQTKALGMTQNHWDKYRTAFA